MLWQRNHTFPLLNSIDTKIYSSIARSSLRRPASTALVSVGNRYVEHFITYLFAVTFCVLREIDAVNVVVVVLCAVVNVDVVMVSAGLTMVQVVHLNRGL